MSGGGWGGGLGERNCFNFSSGCVASPSSALSYVTVLGPQAAQLEISRTTMKVWMGIRERQGGSRNELVHVLLVHDLGVTQIEGARGRVTVPLSAMQGHGAMSLSAGSEQAALPGGALPQVL